MTMPNFTTTAYDLQPMELCDLTLTDGTLVSGSLLKLTETMIGLGAANIMKSPLEQTKGERVFIPLCQVQSIIPRSPR